MNTKTNIVLSRTLTHSGDQAWDFAVPIALTTVLPHRLDLVALIYFVSKIGHTVFLPWLGSLIDQVKAITSYKLGLSIQFLGVALQAVFLSYHSSIPTLSIIGICAGGILSSLGSSCTSIIVNHDLVPSLFSHHELANVNSRIRQVDLASEVCAPVITGIILSLSLKYLDIAGYWIIAIWNLASFFPEYFLIRNILRSQTDRAFHANHTTLKTPLWTALGRGWKLVIKSSVSITILSYSLLWLSVLSPHGVLLTSYLKDSWRTPEIVLGGFRALGAMFGLTATLVFPAMVKKMGVLEASRLCLNSQAVFVTLSLICFELSNQLLFLTFILFSRIGLYGFSLGEQEIRQLEVPKQLRGSLNSSATALNNLANLSLLAVASFVVTNQSFNILIYISAISVVCAALIFKKQKIKSF